MKMKLSELAEGAVQERFETEMQKVLENIVDPNTDAKKKRKLQLTLTFEPNEDRSFAELSVEAVDTIRAFLEEALEEKISSGDVTLIS